MEFFDELDEYGKHTGKTVARDVAHKNGNWHRAVLLFVVNSKNEILMQKRSMQKSLWAGRWDGTGGGHVDSGEIGMFAVIRELKEELGIDVDPSDVRYIGGCLSENKNEKMWNRHWNEFFVAHKDIDETKIKLQESEVEQVKWIDFDTFKKWVKSRSNELTEKWEAFDDLVRYMEKYVLSGNKSKLPRTITEIQKAVYQNKVNQKFNITDVNKEFCLLYGELAEAYEAWRKKKDDLGEELADVAIYLLGLAEIVGADLESEIMKKMLKNTKREYEMKNGVLVKKVAK